MELTIAKVAEFFSVSEHTVERWIETRGLSAIKVRDQYRFNREQLLEWSTVNGVKVSPELLNGNENESRSLPDLAGAIEFGGVFYDIAGTDKAAALKSVVDKLTLPNNEEKELLLQVLLAREALGSTGVGGGVAIPHPRNPIVLDVDRPLVTISFLKSPIDFEAIDNVPVHTLFMVVTPATRIHLHLISRLAFALHDPSFKALLEQRAQPDDLLAAVRRIETTIGRRTAS